MIKEKDSITPDYSSDKRINAMDIYKQLPKNNCKACGEASCFAFATKLTSEERNVMECNELFNAEYAVQRGLLLNMLLESGFDIPAEFI